VDYEQIDYSVAGGVATITLDRPDRLNAFTTRMQTELVDVYDRTDADDDVRAVVLTGRGRGFCAGADLGSGSGTFRHEPGPDGRPSPDTGGLVTLRMFRSFKPIIAAVNGPAVGVGATMTLAADVRLLSTQARMGFVFGARGIVPDAASSWFLPRIVGVSQALEWCLTARVFPAAEALHAGLARSLHEPEDLLPAAYALAEEMAAGVAPVSAAITRQLLWRMLGAPHPMDAHRLDTVAIAQTGAMADAAEGIEAFLGKRPAEWKLRPSVDLPDWWPDWDEPRY
jgi:enoyl-CoA hydratase/carnithine racemase